MGQLAFIIFAAFGFWMVKVGLPEVGQFTEAMLPVMEAWGPHALETQVQEWQATCLRLLLTTFFT